MQRDGKNKIIRENGGDGLISLIILLRSQGGQCLHHFLSSFLLKHKNREVKISR